VGKVTSNERGLSIRKSGGEEEGMKEEKLPTVVIGLEKSQEGGGNFPK